MEYLQPFTLTFLVVLSIYVLFFNKKKPPCFIDFNEAGKHDHTVKKALTSTDLEVLKYNLNTLNDKHGSVDIYQNNKTFAVNYTFSNNNLVINIR